MGYEYLAKIYDVLMSDTDYEQIALRIEKYFKKYKCEPNIILDLCCGTGNLSLELYELGFDVIGVDICEEMLNEAYKKCDEKDIDEILFLNQDATRLNLFGTVDAAVCAMDGINHFMKLSDVKKCFERVFLFLNDGGIFIFDINTVLKFKTQFSNNVYNLETDDVFLSWENSFDEKKGINEFVFHFFEENKDGTYTRELDFCKEKMYEIKEIKDTLNECGFQLLNIFGGEYTNKNYSEDDFRAVFVVKKPKKKRGNK